MAGNIIVPLFAVAAGANNSAPTGAPSETGYGAGTVGKPITYGQGKGKVFDWTLLLSATAMSLVGRLWLYHEVFAPAAPSTPIHVWSPAGVGTDADKGKINGGATIGTATHSERFEGLGPCDGFQLQVTGTMTALLGWMIGVERRA